MNNPQQVIAQTRKWVEKVIVGCNFCPFAHKEVAEESIRFAVSQTVEMERALQDLAQEWLTLDENGEIETTLLIFSQGFTDFEEYLVLLELADQLLQMQGYEGTYQLAHFHPDYCFADAEADDAANYTNRSPYPTLHVIREKSMAEALRSFPEPEKIPQRNIDYAREKGLNAMQQMLDDCLKGDS